MFENTKGVIRRLDSTIDKENYVIEQTVIYKTLHRKLTIKQYEPPSNRRWTGGAPEGQPVPAQHGIPVVLLLLHTLYRWNHIRNHKLWYTGSTEIPTELKQKTHDYLGFPLL